MLQTAKAFAFGEDKSKGVMVNVLLDGGSQISYVIRFIPYITTDATCNVVRIERKSEQIEREMI